MDYLYSLYDALVSINVPTDKARAVVDAMERDMGATLATKVDLQLLKQGLASSEELRAVHADIAALRSDNAAIRSEMLLIRKDMELLSTSMTVRLGSMTFLGLGLLFAALKLTQ